MLSKVNVGGGGGAVSKINSYIAVQYPEDSYCSCTDGSVTLRAGNTSGTVVFSIPSEGNWTITTTDLVKSASKVISVSSGQIYNERLSYDLVLFDLADNINVFSTGFNNPTGGEARVVFNSNGIVCTGTQAAYGHSANSKSKVDFTGFTTMKISGTHSQSNNNWNCYFGLCTSTSFNSPNKDSQIGNVLKSSAVPTGTLTDYTLFSLTGLSGTEYAFYFQNWGDNGSSSSIINTVTITKLYCTNT